MKNYKTICNEAVQLNKDTGILTYKTINAKLYDINKKIISIPLINEILVDGARKAYKFELLNFPEIFISMSKVQPKYEFEDGFAFNDIVLDSDFTYNWIERSDNNYYLEIIVQAWSYLLSSGSTIVPIRLNLDLVIYNERDYNL